MKKIGIMVLTVLVCTGSFAKKTLKESGKELSSEMKAKIEAAEKNYKWDSAFADIKNDYKVEKNRGGSLIFDLIVDDILKTAKSLNEQKGLDPLDKLEKMQTFVDEKIEENKEAWKKTEDEAKSKPVYRSPSTRSFEEKEKYLKNVRERLEQKITTR